MQFSKGNDDLQRAIYLHHQTLRALRQTHEDGCRFCTMLYHGLVYMQDLLGRREESGTWTPAEGSNEQIVLVLASEVREEGMGLLAPGEGIRVWCQERSFSLTMGDLEDRYARFSDEEAEDSDTGSITSMELAKTWLFKCLQNHPECSSSNGPNEPILPKRVVDVGPLDGSQEPYLFIPSSRSHRANYVALSHCWGPHQIITTTKDTITAYQHRIKWAKLSKTFQDAVDVTRKLNMRYIWIDSLCIVQDWAEDWETESAVMGDIYRNAFFTISAARAKDGTEGCFAQRNPKANRPCKLNLYFGKQPQGGVVPTEAVARKSQRSVYVYPFTSGNAVGPLYERAWVYQEQALSTRILAFGKNNIHWLCSSMMANENYPMGYRQKTVMPVAEFLRLVRTDEQHCDKQSGEDRALEKGLEKSEPELDECETEELYDRWYGIVEEYSTRSLTKATDRLPALSGLAAEINKKLEDDQYIAGLWREDLERGLLWSCPDSRNTGVRARPPLQYVAPSWSWASLTGRITSFSYMKQLFRHDNCINEGLEVVGVGRKLKGLNPFGEVLHGIIKISGYLVPVMLGLNVDNVTSEVTKESHGKNTLYTLDTRRAIGGLNLDALEIVDAPIWLLAMVEKQGETEDDWTTVCLALVETGFKAGEWGEYRRVGLAGVDSICFDDAKRKTICIV